VFCVHCGQFLVRTRWVALPPESAAGSPAPKERRGRYTGPPRYLSPPRWGFPALPWRLDKPAEAPSSASIAAGQAGLLVPLLRAVAMLAALAGAAEIWRYVLLLRSRGEALDASQVIMSDTLVDWASWLSTVVCVGVGIYLLVWVLRVIEAAAERSGVRPPRSHRWVVLGWVVPVLNISVPGSVLAEVEHAALGRPPGEPPGRRPCCCSGGGCGRRTWCSGWSPRSGRCAPGCRPGRTASSCTRWSTCWPPRPPWSPRGWSSG